MFLIIGFLISIYFSWKIGEIAEAGGRSYNLWVVLSLIFSPIMTGIVLCLIPEVSIICNSCNSKVLYEDSEKGLCKNCK